MSYRWLKDWSTLFSVKYERIKFLVIALKSSVEIYAWAPKPYHKFMAFKVSLYLYFLYGFCFFCFLSSPLNPSLLFNQDRLWGIFSALEQLFACINCPFNAYISLNNSSDCSVSVSLTDSSCRSLLQSFTELQHKPQLVDLTVEEGQRLKVIYGSSVGFHVIDVDSGNPYDIYIPSHVSVW